MIACLDASIWCVVMGQKGYLAPTYQLLVKHYHGLLEPIARQVKLRGSDSALLIKEVVLIYQENFFLPQTIQRLEDQLTVAATVCHWSHCCDRYRYRMIPLMGAKQAALARREKSYTINPRNWDFWQRLTGRRFAYLVEIWGERDYGAICPTGHPCPPQKVRCEEQCVICWDDAATVIYSPCGHCAVCTGCQSQHGAKSCPMCREEIMACWQSPETPRPDLDHFCEKGGVARWDLQLLVI